MQMHLKKHLQDVKFNLHKVQRFLLKKNILFFSRYCLPGARFKLIIFVYLIISLLSSTNPML